MEATEAFVALLRAWVRAVACEAFQEFAPDHVEGSANTDGAPARLRAQLALIKSKEHITVKEAALLLSCSDSHIRKLVKLALKGKSRSPIPFLHLEGVTVFPLRDLLEWASPRRPPQTGRDENTPRKKAA
jgi:hypothetical protein